MSLVSSWFDADKLVNGLQRRLLRYWQDGAGPLLLSADAAVNLSATDIGWRIVVLARRHYQEFYKTYPLKDAKELKAVLQHEYADEPYVLHQFDRTDPSVTRVNSYVLDKALIEANPAAVYFPETLLLANARGTHSAQDMIWDCAEKHGFYFYRQAGLSVSQRVGPLCNSPLLFAFNNGLPETLSCYAPESSAYRDALLDGLKHCLINGKSYGCWPLQRLDVYGYNWKKWATITAVALATYLAVVTAYLQLSISWRQNTLEALGPGVNSLLDNQSQQQIQADAYNAIMQSRMQRQHSAQLWSLVQTMVSDKVAISALMLEGNALVIRGTAPRATQLLETLLTSPFVKTAEFSAPVRKESDAELFAITVVLAGQPVIAAPAEVADGQ